MNWLKVIPVEGSPMASGAKAQNKLEVDGVIDGLKEIANEYKQNSRK